MTAAGATACSALSAASEHVKHSFDAGAAVAVSAARS